MRTAAFVIAAGLAACTGRGSDDASVDGAMDALDAIEDAEVDAPEARAPTVCDTASTASITTIARFATGRYAPVAFLTRDGRALVAGGYDFRDGIQYSADLVDAAAMTLVPSMPLQNPRNFAAATALESGDVLITGGFDPLIGSLQVAERYDATSGEFVQLDSATRVGREAHTATRLPDGSVLVAGGLQAMGFHFHDTAERFDAATSVFTTIAARMTTPRAFHDAVYLPTRRAVLLVGGDSGHGELATAERFDIDRNVFESTANTRQHAGKAVAAVMLRDGRVLVTGGSNASDGTLADADLYDPATDRFTPAAPMHTRRMAHTLTLLDDGRVLAAGGWSDSTMPAASSDTLEVYDPSSDAWTLLPVTLASGRLDHRVVVLPDCRVLVVGGQHVVGTTAPNAPREVELLTVPNAAR